MDNILSAGISEQIGYVSSVRLPPKARVCHPSLDLNGVHRNCIGFLVIMVLTICTEYVDKE